MAGLMVECINWGETDCHPDVSVHKHSDENKDRGHVPLRPIGDAFEELDEICKSCELRFIEIDKRKCPACGGHEFTEKTGLEIKNDGTKIFENAYLKCNKCDSPSILLKLQ